MPPRISLDGQDIPFLQHYRVDRPDVARAAEIGIQYAGLVLEYLVPEPLLYRRFASLSFTPESGAPLIFNGTFEFMRPHYRELFDADWVYHRENIYGSGPPNTEVNPETFAIARRLKDPILDFGCGSGALIGKLRQFGLKAQGLELDTEIIKTSIRPAVQPFVTLYNGQLPSPFPSGSFKSVFCSEVLEHIPNYEAAIQDIARLATHEVVFTVPDASAIGMGFRHGAVPWHLLEGTHVNFFTQTSLNRKLQPYFSKIEFGRLGRSHFNDSAYYVSLLAACLK